MPGLTSERILVATKDTGRRERLARLLGQSGYQVLTADDGVLVPEMARKHAAEIVVVDAAMLGTASAVENTGIDPLTGLPSRLMLMDRLGRLLERTKREKDYLFALLLVDIDRFSDVNDTLGRGIADLLLVNTGGRLSACLRSGDTVARDSQDPPLARFGGDEFAILLDRIETPANAMLVAKRMHRQLGFPHNLDGHTVLSTASIGIVTSATPHTCAEDLVRHAAMAAKRAQKLGGARTEVFGEALEKQVSGRVKMETSLRKALALSEFSVHYQPIYNLQAGAFERFEALVRWQHSDSMAASPSEFIPVCEATGLIVPLGKWVMNEACDQLAHWRSRFGMSALSVSVNLSARQFLSPDLADDIDRILCREGFEPSCLQLELTESVLIEDTEAAIDLLSGLRERGIKISIDDFGTGYSSLSFLSELPADSLKIDQTFIERLRTDGGGAKIIAMIVNLAHDLNLTVIAEGVENEVQLEQLKRLGCDCAQGNYFSTPMSAEETTGFLDDLCAQRVSGG